MKIVSDFKFISEYDNTEKDFTVLSGTIMVGKREFTIYLTRPLNRLNLDFLVNAVKVGPQVVWKYGVNCPRGSIVFLMQVSNHKLLVLLESGVYGRIFDLVNLAELTGDEKLSLSQMVEFKKKLGTILERDVLFSKEEEAFDLKKLEEVAAAIRVQVQAVADAEKAKKAKARKRREERRQELLARQPISVYVGPQRMKRSGIPVTETEWEKLPKGKHVVLVESYCDEELGKPTEYFVVGLKGALKTKEGLLEVTTSELEARNASRTVPVAGQTALEVSMVTYSVVKMTRAGNQFEVRVYRNSLELKEARLAGQCGGCKVTASDRIDDGRYEVFAIPHHGVGMKTLGFCKLVEEVYKEEASKTEVA